MNGTYLLYYTYTFLFLLLELSSHTKLPIEEIFDEPKSDADGTEESR